jgi:hypothetical protein
VRTAQEFMYRTDDPPEEIWRGWAQKGKRRQETITLRLKMTAGICMLLMALGAAVYLDLR